MKDTQIITILVSVALILFLHYTMTHSCEYFGVGSGRGGGAGPSQGPGLSATTNCNTCLVQGSKQCDATVLNESDRCCLQVL